LRHQSPEGDGAQGDAWTYTTGDCWGIIFHFEAEYQNVIFKKVFTGVKGTLPLGCLPLWGGEGVILVIFKKRRPAC
jgi:hypothetical protein